MTAPWEGSPLAYDYAVRADQWVTLRDGRRLATDVYLPALGGHALPGPFPVVLERTPYDRTRTWHSITARYFARRGYAAVVQDVRGRYASEGEFYFLRHEAEDGLTPWRGSWRSRGAMARSARWGSPTRRRTSRPSPS